jgi:hypothetical protein
MAHIRADLTGVVHTDRGVFKAGDEIPDGVSIGGHLTDTGEPVGPFKTVSGPAIGGDVHVHATDVARADAVDPLSEGELVEAARIGVPLDVHPERVRGAILGYAQGWDDAHAAFTVPPLEQPDGDVTAVIPGQGELIVTGDPVELAEPVTPTFDPAEHNAAEVHAYLKANPDDAGRVRALEAAGKNRSGILGAREL